MLRLSFVVAAAMERAAGGCPRRTRSHLPGRLCSWLLRISDKRVFHQMEPELSERLS